jgi:hypothetical protein
MRAIPEKYLPPDPEPSRIEQMQARLKERKAVEPAKVEPGPLDEILKTVVALSTQQQDALSQIAEYSTVVARCVEEIARPKPVKKWGCVVSRNATGQINNVDIEEK